MIWSLSFDPLVPLWVLGFLGVAILVIALVTGFMRLRGWVLRALTMALVALALANPAIEREDREQLSSVVAVVADRSQSQLLADRSAVTDETVQTLNERLAALPGFEVRVLENTSSSTGDGTELFQTLLNGLSDVPPDRIGGAILVTDGQIHDIPETADALGFEAPVHGLITGEPDERDRRLVLHKAPRFGLVGSEQVVSIRIVERGPGTGPGNRVTLRVRRDGTLISERQAGVGETIDIPVEIAHG
ncbi:MAG: hypothetical protein ABJO05_15415, partial [Roseibium sp.]